MKILIKASSLTSPNLLLLTIVKARILVRSFNR